jgi:hypothetical protein
MPQSTRWTAGILSLVMLASAFVPIALGQSMQSSGMHCLRRKNIAPDKMPCHGAMEKESVGERRDGGRRAVACLFERK